MGPFTVDELVLRHRVTVMDACMIVWEVPPVEFAHYLAERHKPSEWTGNQSVHHGYGESRG
jgi:hypothetical protein